MKTFWSLFNHNLIKEFKVFLNRTNKLRLREVKDFSSQSFSSETLQGKSSE